MHITYGAQIDRNLRNRVIISLYEHTSILWLAFFIIYSVSDFNYDNCLFTLNLQFFFFFYTNFKLVQFLAFSLLEKTISSRLDSGQMIERLRSKFVHVIYTIRHSDNSCRIYLDRQKAGIHLDSHLPWNIHIKMKISRLKYINCIGSSVDVRNFTSNANSSLKPI